MSPVTVAADLRNGPVGRLGVAALRRRRRGRRDERHEGDERDERDAADHGGGPSHCTFAVVLSISSAAVMTLEFIS